MANRPAAPLVMTAEQRAELERIARSSSRPHRELGLAVSLRGRRCGSMAARAGISEAMVRRIWSSRGIKLHLVRGRVGVSRR